MESHEKIIPPDANLSYLRGLVSERISIINRKILGLHEKLGRDVTLADLQRNAAEDIGEATPESALVDPLCVSSDVMISLTGLEVYAWFLKLQIVVFKVSERQSRSEAFLYFRSSVRQPQDRTIFLELLEHRDRSYHYNVITSISGYLGGRNGKQFCFSCFKATGKLKNHACKNGCAGCNSDDVCFEEVPEKCPDCFRMCKSAMCLSRHQEKANCVKKTQCKKCNINLLPRDVKKHKCLSYYCVTCRIDYTESPHHCFMTPIPIDQDKESHNIIMVFFDIESQFVKLIGREYHEPDLLCALVVCKKCYKPENVLRKVRLDWIEACD